MLPEAMSVVAEDFIRQVKSFLENYEPQLENKNWLKRRMRFLLETFTQEHSDAAALDTIWIWRLICTEVLYTLHVAVSHLFREQKLGQAGSSVN